jgi:tetratricopeptide (TPR) repeat protein
MTEDTSRDTPRTDATLPMPAELAREGGGERFGKFQLSKRLGAGVSHDLWQAWDPEKQAWLALRVWPRPPAGAKEAVLAAGKKARAAGDPRIVPPAGGGLEAGQLWYARPYFEALPVKDLPWQDGRTLAHVAKECAQALAVAHGKGLSHGRVTAGNVLVVSREVKAGEGGWIHDVKLTEFGLEDGTPAGDVRGLGRIFCELTGQPAPGGGPTTKAATGTSGDTTSAAQVKGDTTRDASSEGRIAIDGSLAGIFLRARDGQLDAASMTRELAAWQEAKPTAAPAKRPWLAIAAVAAVILAVAGGIELKGRAGTGGDPEALAESARAEAEGRLEAALERARAAAAANPKDGRAAAAVKRLEAAVAARDAFLASARTTEAAAQQAERQRGQARSALRAAQDAARSAHPDREVVDKALTLALGAIEEVLRLRPEDPAALRLLEDAATLFQPGDLSLLPRDAEGKPVLTPVLVLRADLTAWAYSCWGPRGLGEARPERPPASYRLALFPPPASTSSAPALQAPDPATPGRIARILAEAPPHAGESATSVAWRSAARALLALDAEGALKAARGVTLSADDPVAPDLEWIQGAADAVDNEEHFKRALAARPWDSLFILSRWVERRSKGLTRESLEVLESAVGLHPASNDLLVARAWTRCYMGRYDEALQELLRADADPASHLVRALVFFAQGKQEECERECTAALKIDPKHVLALVYRSETRVRLRNPKGALEDAEAAVNMDPGRVDALQIRASARSAVGDRAGALADCERSITLSPMDPDTYQIRGWVHIHASEYSEAIQDADLALKLDDRDARALALRAMAKMLLGRDAEAILDAEAALQLDTGESRACVVLGVASLHRGDRAGAKEHCTRALRLSPGLPEGIRLRAFICLSESDFSGAIEDATDYLEIRPKDMTVLLLRARARLRAGVLNGAKEDCEAAIELNPRLVEALIIRARVRSALRATGAAIPAGSDLEDLDRALALEPKNLEALEFKAAQLSLAGRNREAAETMSKVLEISPRSAEYRVLRAGYRELAGDLEGAMADAEALIRDEPKSAAGFYRRSSLLMKKGDLEGAKLDAVDGTRAEPGNAKIWRQLGDVYRAQKEKERAIAAYEQVLLRAAVGDPDRVAAEASIAKLKGK